MADDLDQRQPREVNSAYKGWISELPCVACLVNGKYQRGVHVAHIRMSSLEHGKRETGMQEKSSDQWCLPLCPPHHTGDSRRVSVTQHAMSEQDFWAHFNINPFELAIALFAAWKAGKNGRGVIAMYAARARKL